MSVPSIVLDPGSYTTKIGVSGNLSPTFILPSKLPGHESFVTDSFISDFSEFERYFETITSENLQISPSDWSVVCSVPCGAGRRYRETLAEIFFETFGVPGVFFEETGIFAMHATTAHSATACVLELGHRQTTLSAVVEGYLVTSEKFPIAGADVSAFISDCVMRREFPDERDPEICRKIRKISSKVKEEFAFVAEDVLAVHTEFSRNFARHKKTVFGLEFGYERFMASEILFDPNLSAKKFPGLVGAVENLVTSKVPVDYRKRLMNNFVLCGGTSLLAGLEKRLKKDLPKNLRPEFFPWASSGLQGHAVWTGASVVADAPDFSARVITRARWEDEGSRIFSLNK